MTINATVIGYLGRDPETSAANGYTITRVSLAASYGFGDRKRTTWVNASAFGKAGEAIMRFKKGDQIALHGELYEDTYEVGGVVKKSIKLDAKSVTFIGGYKPELPEDATADETIGNKKPQTTFVPSDDDVPF